MKEESMTPNLPHQTGDGMVAPRSHSEDMICPQLPNEEKDSLWEILGKSTTYQTRHDFTQRTVDLARRTPQDLQTRHSLKNRFLEVIEAFKDDIQSQLRFRPIHALSAVAAVFVVFFFLFQLSSWQPDHSESSLLAMTPDQSADAEDDWITKFVVDRSNDSPDAIFFGNDAADALHRHGNQHVLLEQEAMFDGNDELMLMLTAL